MPVIRLLVPALTLVLALSSACAPSAQSRRYSRAKAQESLAKLETPGLLIGEFGLNSKSVVDGDTLKVDGLETSLRLLALDTEETFKREKNRRAAEADFDKYLRDLRGDRKRPIKTGTPMGEAAKKFAKQFFADVDTVRIERDHPKDVRGRFGRYLAYVFAKKDGKWVNYNVECVRAGMSPYFSKYGYSRRFHDDFVAAEAEARAAKRGIWDSSTQNYDDYDERKVWWDARAEFVKEFERDAEGRDDYIVLTHWDALDRLEHNVGKTVTVLTTVGDVVLGDRGPTRVQMSRRMFGDVPAIFWDSGVFAATGLGSYSGEFVRITGVVAEYTFKRSGRKVVQLVVGRSSDVTLSPVPGLEDVWQPRQAKPSAPETSEPVKTDAAELPDELDDDKLPVFGPETEAAY